MRVFIAWLISICIFILMLGHPVFGIITPYTLWINSKTVKASNPFFTNGITITIDGKKYELGLREDGVVVWKHSK